MLTAFMIRFFFHTYVFVCVCVDRSRTRSLSPHLADEQNSQKWRKCSKLIHFCYWCWCRCVVYGFLWRDQLNLEIDGTTLLDKYSYYISDRIKFCYCNETNAVAFNYLIQNSFIEFKLIHFTTHGYLVGLVWFVFFLLFSFHLNRIHLF